MKINEIIREQRLTKKFTQEQVAGYLGVTSSAVNKWEKGISYPDITILPALARLLDTDLNTLLSFKEELTEKEVAEFINYLAEIRENKGFEEIYEIAMKKVKEYPTCDFLVLNTALFLDGLLTMDGDCKVHNEDYESVIESLYQRAAESSDGGIRSQAQSLLISKFMQRKEYDKAEEMLKLLPDRGSIDKKQLQVNLLIEYGELEEASKLEEEKLLSAVNEIQTILITLMEIALKENRMEDAKYIADVSGNSAKLFDLWEYNSYVAHFQFYSACKNYIKCIQTFIPMIKSLTHKWDLKKSPLYRHMKTKEVDKGFGLKIQKNLIKAMYSDEETSFLKDSQEVQALVKKLNLDKKEIQ